MNFDVGQTISPDQFKTAYPIGTTIPASHFQALYPQQQQQQSEQPAQGPVSKAVSGVADFLGIKKAGQGLATAFRQLAGHGNVAADTGAQSDQNNTQLLQLLHQMVLDHVPANDPKRVQLVNYIRQINGQQPVTEGQIDPGTSLSNKEVIGSFGNLATDIVGADVGSGEGETIGGRLLNAGAKNAAVGFAGGVSQGLNDNQSIGDTFKEGAQNAGVQGVFGVGAQVLGELGKVLTTNLPKAMVEKKLGIPAKVIAAGRSPAQDLIDNGGIAFNTKRQILAKAEEAANSSDTAITKILENVAAPVQTKPILSTIADKLTETYGNNLTPDEIQSLIKNLPIAGLQSGETIDAKTLNKMRQVIDSRYLGNAAWLRGAAEKQPESVTALKLAANAIRSTVQNLDAKLPPLFDQWSNAITTKTAITKDLAKPHVLTAMIELLSSGLGGVMSSHGINPEAITKAAAGYAGYKALTSTPATTAAAVGLRKIGKAASSELLKAPARLASQAAIRRSTSQQP